ncbi:RHS repeat-associated core domain-containing protein, partial [Chryseobacterium sp.]|uniref:RHS repeat domain-containing protein n=1 Tax=Chryseobacterium sp. TaxID=1871047 RepID=UPI002FC9CFE2
FVPTAEGYYNFENNKYIYHYTDHLGNIRLSFTKNSSGAAIIEESNFYPYGMKQENNVQSNPAYNYEQSGKEFQKETGWSDFGARMYMADIGRWGVIDPLAETTRRINPYNYALDNPISYVDPDGRKAIAPNGFEILQPLNGALGYMIGGGSAVFGSFEEFLGQGAPIGFSQLGDTGLGGGGGGGSTGIAGASVSAQTLSY